MKKILLALVVVLTVAFSVNAQSDGWFQGGANDGDLRGTPGVNEPLIPHGTIGDIIDHDAANTPIGSGLLILTALGGAYMLRKHYGRE